MATATATRKKTATRKPATSRNGKRAVSSSTARPARSAGPVKWPAWPGEVKKGDGVKTPSARVKVWQWALSQRVRQTLPVDGRYGDATYHCCVAWQKDHPIGRPIMEKDFPKGFMGEHMWHSLSKNL